MKKKSFLGFIGKTVAAALVFGVVGAATFSGSSYLISKTTKQSTTQHVGEVTISTSDTIEATNTAATVQSTDISGVVSQAMPSIVAITTLSQEEVNSYFGQGQTIETEAAGSGIIVKEDDTSLYIATNNHVVSGATTLTVQFSDESTATATIRGTDANNDLAVIQVNLSDLSTDTLNEITVASLGDSTSLAVGDGAIAIGNALGYGQSVTTGVISAVNREVTFQDETTGATVSNKLLQTDAAINPGNSGGALINTSGEVIGINSSKYSDTSVEGMGFAIPIETAQPILDDIIENGKTTTTGTPYLGIYGVDVTDDVSNSYNMPKGVYIAKVVSNSGAANAGIVETDIISAVDGAEITSMTELKSKIGEYKVGDTVTITVQKANNGDYTKTEVSVTLTSQGQVEEAPSTNSDDSQVVDPFAGIPNEGNE